jgi:hypothetical protein
MVQTVRSLALALVVTCFACGGPATSPPTATASRSLVAATVPPSVTPTSATTSTVGTAPFLRTALIDVRTGERFTLAGLGGKTVIVQGMAVW